MPACGYSAPPGRAKAAGYTLMHLGAAVGFMAKSAPGWLVPAVALIALIVWERRFSELRRWELYVGLLLQLVIIGPWVAAVAASAHGTQALRVLFWNNLAGRFMHVAAPAALDYTSGHRNFPGKYLIELPLYLLPWTLIVAAALVRALRGVRAPGARGSPWRYAFCASVPFLALLSVAATARDIYAAPSLLGFALLAGLWVHEAREPLTGFERWMLRLTPVLMMLMGAALAAALLVVAAAGAASPGGAMLAAAAALACAILGLLAARRAGRRQDPAASLLWGYGGYAAAVCLTALVALPMIDGWQDLPRLAARIHEDTAQQRLALLNPDETTLAMLDRGAATTPTVIRSDDADPRPVVAQWFAAHGATGRLLLLLPGHAPGPLSRFLARFRPLSAPGDGTAASLIGRGAATLIHRYELPQGRRYALLGPPLPPSPQ
jgi:4-amino-4-deoxy-L-arabinose transferase-like glycosyltransferase